MFKAERCIADLRSAYLARTVADWRGYERMFLIELVRALDEAAFAFKMAPNRGQLVREDAARHAILWGAASALRPFLEAVEDDPGRVPWGPTSPKLSALADQHLLNCGRMALVQRLAALERYGLARAIFRSDEYLVLEIASDEVERTERRSGSWLNGQQRERLTAAEARMAGMKNEIAERIDRYTDVHDGWFIRYAPEWDVIQYHRNYATFYAAGVSEAEALPATALLGGREFADWNDVSLTALGRLLHHIACVTRLMERKEDLELRNLLTAFARKEDVVAVWQQTGETRARAKRIVEALTLDIASAVSAETDHEIPLPYYIDFGRHFVLLPMFGGLMNPHAGLVRHLRRAQRSEWDRAVDGREEVFRRELQELLSAPRYGVLDHGIRLKRADGSDLTDVDAVILDTQAGSLIFVQMKWPDVYRHSLAERNSRRVNLLKANEWVSRVHDWIGGRSASEVASTLALGRAGDLSPSILVLARHIVRFVGETDYDRRAHWISWPKLVQLRTQWPQRGVLDLLIEQGEQEHLKEARESEHPITRHELPGLTVEVRTSD